VFVSVPNASTLGSYEGLGTPLPICAEFLLLATAAPVLGGSGARYVRSSCPKSTVGTWRLSDSARRHYRLASSSDDAIGADRWAQDYEANLAHRMSMTVGTVRCLTNIPSLAAAGFQKM
jgi:hypothetical protein